MDRQQDFEVRTQKYGKEKNVCSSRLCKSNESLYSNGDWCSYYAERITWNLSYKKKVLKMDKDTKEDLKYINEMHRT